MDNRWKGNFYNQLSSLTQSVPPHDLLFILGDFNAAPGPGDASVESIGPFSSGTGTTTPRDCWHTVACTTWSFLAHGSDAWISTAGHGCRTNHDHVTKKEIDHILTRKRDRGVIKSYRTFCSVEAPANTDHVLLVSQLHITSQNQGRLVVNQGPSM